MAIRVGQVNVQYVADTADASDLRVTRVFGQAVIPSKQAGITKSITDNIFADASDSSAEITSNIYSITQNLFSVTGQTATYEDLHNYFVQQSLGLDQTGEALYRAIAHQLFGGGTGSIGNGAPDQEYDITQYLGFTDRTVKDITQILFGRTDTSGVKASAADEVREVIERIFDLFNSSTAVVAYGVTQSLGLTPTAKRDITREIEESFGFAETLDLTGMNYTRNISHSLFTQSVSYFTDDNRCRELKYDPIIGDTTGGEYDEFLTSQPTLASVTATTFEYPPTSPTSTLNLTLPEFGNVEVNNFQRIDRKTRGGARQVYTDQKWATWDRFELAFAGVHCTTTIDNIIDFLNTTLGKEVRFTDHEGRQWLGIIVAPETEVEQRVDGLSVQIVFEGRIATLEVVHDEFDVTHDVDGDGDDIEVVYEE